MAGWKALALNRVELLEDEVRVLEQSGVTVPNDVEQELTHIRDEHGLSDTAAKSDRAGSFIWSDERNHAWDEIHRLEASIERMRPSADDVVDAARVHAEDRLTVQRRKQFEDDLTKEHDDARRKTLALRVIQEAHEASARKHEAERQQSRGILVLATLLIFGGIATVVLQWRAFPESALVTAPAGSIGLSSWTLLMVVMMFGMLGGGFSALMSLYVTNKTYADTYWFDPRPGLALMKISIGLWAALLGVLGVASGPAVPRPRSLIVSAPWSAVTNCRGLRLARSLRPRGRATTSRGDCKSFRGRTWSAAAGEYVWVPRRRAPARERSSGAGSNPRDRLRALRRGGHRQTGGRLRPLTRWWGVRCCPCTRGSRVSHAVCRWADLRSQPPLPARCLQLPAREDLGAVDLQGALLVDQRVRGALLHHSAVVEGVGERRLDASGR